MRQKFKEGEKVRFTKEAIEFGIGKQRNIGIVKSLRNKARGVLITVVFENGIQLEINSSWIEKKDR